MFSCELFETLQVYHIKRAQPFVVLMNLSISGEIEHELKAEIV